MTYGAQTKIGIARQAAANTWVIAPTSFHGIAFTNEDIGYESQELVSANLTGRFEEGAVYPGLSNIAGTIECEMTPRSIGASLAACLNHVPVSVTSASIRTLSFLPNTQDFSSTLCKAPFTFYKQFSDANSAQLFYDVQFGQIEFAFSQGAFAKLRLTSAGGTLLPNGVGSASIAADFADTGRLFPWNVTSISYNGAGMGENSDITVTVNENIAPIYTINGTLAPFKFTRENFRQITVNGTMYMQDRTFLNNFVNGTQARLVITSINTVAAIQSGYFNTLTLDVPQAKLTAFKPSVSGPGELAVPFTMRGVLDPTSLYAFQAIMVTTWQAGF
jgi:hypothetical protein